MATLFRANGLIVTDDWVRAATGTYAIRDVRAAWTTRRQAGRRGRLLVAVLGVVALLILVTGAGLIEWLIRHWIWILAAPLVLVLAASIGLLDPIAIYLEKRHHELWIATDVVAVCVWKHNSVEVNKALRAIQRACERHREQYEV